MAFAADHFCGNSWVHSTQRQQKITRPWRENHPFGVKRKGQDGYYVEGSHCTPVKRESKIESELNRNGC